MTCPPPSPSSCGIQLKTLVSQVGERDRPVGGRAQTIS